MLLLVLLACTSATPASPPAAESADDEEPAASPAEEQADDWPDHCPEANESLTYKNPTWAQRDMCERIRYACPDGFDFWGDPDCGCGCKKLEPPADGPAELEPPAPATSDWPAECPRPSADLTYMHSTWEGRERCRRIRYRCKKGFAPWSDATCGCGCKRMESP